MRKLKIYDYADNAVTIDLPDKDIKRIYVSVVSGDEIVRIVYTDGSLDFYDSSKTRIFSFNDGRYIVEGEDIERFINWEPTSDYYYSYDRYEEFTSKRRE